MDAQPTNAEQARMWNGPSGVRWVDHNERHDRMLAGYLAPIVEAVELSATDRILDVGCGTGALTRATARLAVDGQATGVDISSLMIASAREIADAEGPINAAFEQADAQTHAFPAGGFDTLVSRFGVMFFDDLAAAFANLHRAVRPGGRVAFCCWQGLADNEWLSLPAAAVAEHVTVPEAPPDAPGPLSLADEARVRRVLTDAGYEDVGLTTVGGPMWLGADADDTVAFLSGTQAIRRLLAGADEGTADKALGAMRDALAGRAGPHGVALSGRAWLVTARA